MWLYVCEAVYVYGTPCGCICALRASAPVRACTCPSRGGWVLCSEGGGGVVRGGAGGVPEDRRRRCRELGACVCSACDMCTHHVRPGEWCAVVERVAADACTAGQEHDCAAVWGDPGRTGADRGWRGGDLDTVRAAGCAEGEATRTAVCTRSGAPAAAVSGSCSPALAHPRAA